MSFRRLVDDDLPMLHRWLNEPGVVRWWEGDDVSWDGVVATYGSGSTDPTEHWIAVVDGVDVGWIQCYSMVDEPDEALLWCALGIDETAAGVDYLIGEAANRGRGVGSAMLAAFVADVVFALHPDWTQAAAAPLEANRASWGALERAGFRSMGTVDDPGGPCRLMAIDRPPAEP